MNVKCKNCNEESEIREQKLMFSEEKSLEDAYCPECEEKIYEGITDGWFIVQKTNNKHKEDAECKFPMP